MKERKKKKNNAKFSGHYVCPRTKSVNYFFGHPVYATNLNVNQTSHSHLLFISKSVPVI